MPDRGITAIFNGMVLSHDDHRYNYPVPDESRCDLYVYNDGSVGMVFDPDDEARHSLPASPPARFRATRDGFDFHLFSDGEIGMVRWGSDFVTENRTGKDGVELITDTDLFNTVKGLFDRLTEASDVKRQLDVIFAS